MCLLTEHLFPAPDMKRGTHAHEANRSARASHMRPGPLTFKATHVVICSSLPARGRCPHTLSPCLPDLRDCSSCLESYYTQQSPSAKGLSEARVQLEEIGRRQMGHQGSAGLSWSSASGWQSSRPVSLLFGKYSSSNPTC